MKKILVITISLLFAALVALGNTTLHNTAQYVGQEVTLTTLDYVIRTSGQDVVITFDQAPATAYSVEIYDLTGKRVANWSRQKSTDKEVTFTCDKSLNSGLYIVRVTAGKQVATKKFQI